MKQIITMITCIAIIIIGGIFEIKYLEKSSLFLKSDIEYIQNAVQNKNFEIANSQFETTYSSWQNIKSIWGIFINHEEIANIDEQIVTLKETLKQENEEDSLLYAELIKKDIEYTIERQELRAENIL